MNNKEKEIFLRKRYSAEKRFRFFGISSKENKLLILEE